MRNLMLHAACLLGTAGLAWSQVFTNGTWPYQHFKSTNYTAPTLQIQKSGGQLSEGLLVFYPEQPLSSSLIMSDDGQLVWSGPLELGTLPSIQVLNGHDVLVRWTGYVAKGYGYGSVKILDHTYTQIYDICPKLDIYAPNALVTPECYADTHELITTPRNTVVVSAYNVTQADLTSVGGPANGWVVDGQFYDLDPATAQPVFSWSALAHVPVSKTTNVINGTGGTPPDAFDYFHLNAVQPLASGQYLVNGRYTSAMYLINPDGSIEWEFNGYNGGDFALAPADQFAFQHDSRIEPDGDNFIVHFFNNDNSEVRIGKNISTGLDFHLDTKKMQAKLLRKVYDPKIPLYVIAQGSYQPTNIGNVLLDYGELPLIQEFGPHGDKPLLSIVFANLTSNGTYRVQRADWTGLPYYPPSLYVDGKADVAYVSWNGATSVTSYELFGGKTPKKLKPIGKFTKTGFETEYKIGGKSSESSLDSDESASELEDGSEESGGGWGGGNGGNGGGGNGGGWGSEHGGWGSGNGGWGSGNGGNGGGWGPPHKGPWKPGKGPGKPGKGPCKKHGGGGGKYKYFQVEAFEGSTSLRKSAVVKAS